MPNGSKPFGPDQYNDALQRLYPGPGARPMTTMYDSALSRALRARIKMIIEEESQHLLMGRAISYDNYLGRCHEINTLTSLLEIIDGIEEQIESGDQVNPAISTKGRKK